MVGGRRSDRGVAMVEFALLAPLLLLLMLGIVEFGRAYNVQIAIQAGVREGARELALDNPDWADAMEHAAQSADIDEVTHTPCPQSGDGQATVTASQDFDLLIPFFEFDTLKLSATGAMRCGL